MLLQQQGGAMNIQLPQVGSVQQTSALTSQVQQTTINPVHSGTQQLTIQQQPAPPQQNLQQQTNALAQVTHLCSLLYVDAPFLLCTSKVSWLHLYDYMLTGFCFFITDSRLFS